MKRIPFISALASSASTRPVVFRNTVSQIVGRLIQASSSFLVTILLARAYGASGYGEFAKVIAYVPLFYLLSDFGMNAVFIREEERRVHTQSMSSWQQLFDTRIYISIIGILAACGILALLSRTSGNGFNGIARIGILLYLPTIVFQGVITSANAVFQFQHRYDYAARAITVGSTITILGALCTVLFVHSETGILWALAALALGSSVTAGWSIFFVSKFHPLQVFVTGLVSARSLITGSIPLAMTLVFNLIYFRADILIMTFLRSSADVGVYGFAYRFFEFPLFIPTFFMNAVFPFMIKRKSLAVGTDRTGYSRLLHASLRTLLISSLALSAVFWFAAPLLSYVKPDFQASVTVLRILSLSLPFFFLTSLTMWMFITEAAYTELATVYFLSMLANILLNLHYIPAYGYIASAWITVATEILTLLLSVFIYGWMKKEKNIV